MRTVEFRGYSLEKEEWVYGSLVTDNEGFYLITELDEHRRPHSTLVHPESVGQFTHNFDKHRTRIYEGDILEVEVSGGWRQGTRRATVTFINNGFYAVEEGSQYERGWDLSPNGDKWQDMGASGQEKLKYEVTGNEFGNMRGVLD